MEDVWLVEKMLNLEKAMVLINNKMDFLIEKLQEAEGKAGKDEDNKK